MPIITRSFSVIGDLNNSGIQLDPTATPSTKKTQKRKARAPKSSEPPSKSIRQCSDAELYAAFKKSYYHCVMNSLDEVDEVEKNKECEIINQLKMFLNVIKGLQSKQMYYYCLIGRNMMQLKEDHKHDNKKLDKFLEQLDFKKGNSTSNRDFFIDYYKLTLEYNKLMYVTMPYSNIKNKFGMLKDRIKNDKEFVWKTVI